MNKKILRFLNFFLVFFLVFGLIGSIFGIPSYKNNEINSISISNQGIKTITIINKLDKYPTKFNLIETSNGDYIYKLKDNDIYISIEGYFVNKNNQYIDGIKGEIITKSNDRKKYSTTTFNRMDFCSNNPNSCSIEELQTLQTFPNNKIIWKPIYKNLKKEYKILSNCPKKDEECKKNSQIKYDKAYAKAKLNKDINVALNTMTKDEQKAFIKGYNNENNNCDVGFGLNDICNFFSKQSTDELALISYQSKLEDLKNGNYKNLKNLGYQTNGVETAKKKLENIKTCISKPSTTNCITIDPNIDLPKAQENYINKYNKFQIKMALKGSKKFENTCNSLSVSDCLTKIKNKCKTLKDNPTCTQIEDKLNFADTQSLVKTNYFFDILKTLATPDQDALYATKLFGFEPDYSNIPKMLKASISSQICSAKIDGYLDKDRIDNGGITTYGCTDTYKNNYDPNTGLQVITGDPNCVNILLDLRAQRTQITPNNKVSITYSSYIKAPKTQDIEYFLAISYQLKDGTTKKQLLKPSQTFTLVIKDTKKRDFATIDLPLNISKNKIDDSSGSFIIGLLALYKNSGTIYIQKSTPITLITGTNYFNSISNNAKTTQSSQTNNAYSNTKNSKKLNSNSMLNMIQI